MSVINPTPNMLTSGAPGTSGDFIFEVVRGNVPGHSLISIPSYNSNIGTTQEDIWEYSGTTFTYFSSAATLKISSTSSSDDSPSGTGARTVQITGLDSNYNEITETITMNGQSAVTTTQSFLRLNRALVVTAGSTGSNVGTIYIYNSSSSTTGGVPNTTSAIQTIIDPDKANISFNSHYTVPAGKTAYACHLAIGSQGSLNFLVRLMKRLFNELFIQDEIFTFAYGNGIPSYNLTNIFPEKTDLKLVAQASASGGVVSCNMNIILIDN